MTPLRYTIMVLLFWLVLGGMFQLFNLDNYDDGNTLGVDTDKSLSVGLSKFGWIWDLMTFNINGMPTGFRIGLTTFFSASLIISVYVLIRSGS